MHARRGSVEATFDNGTIQNSPAERESVSVRFIMLRSSSVAILSDYFLALCRKSDLDKTKRLSR